MYAIAYVQNYRRLYFLTVGCMRNLTSHTYSPSAPMIRYPDKRNVNTLRLRVRGPTGQPAQCQTAVTQSDYMGTFKFV